MKFPYTPAEPLVKNAVLSLYPPTTDNSLRPWDGADEYLLTLYSEEYGDKTPLKTALVNDAHGALSVPLASSAAVCLNDSFSSRKSIAQNMKDNGLTEEPPFAGFLEDFSGEVDLILMKVPKALPLFRYQLSRLAEQITKPVTILAAGSSKLLQVSFYETFDDFTDESEYSLIKKRARYYRGQLRPAEKKDLPAQQFRWKEKDFTTLPGVFSYGKPDMGTLFLLEHFPRVEAPQTIVDPGCGCGILGVQAALTWPEARIIATDDSALAVESTRRSARQNGVEERIDYRHTNIMEGLEDSSADLVICNPPFHSEHRVALESGMAFIEESFRVLKTGGQLFMVANRYLGYEKKLKELFQGTLIIGQNKKYRVHMCRK